MIETDRQTVSELPEAAVADPGRAAVLAFCETPFAIRGNVVKVWKPLPAGLWTALGRPQDDAPARGRERGAFASVVLMCLFLAVAGSLVYRPARTAAGEVYPVIGRPLAGQAGPATGPGWALAPGVSAVLLFWVIVPSLAGWAAVRLAWIPLCGGAAACNLARHLASVYAYVYLMITVGAVLMAALVAMAPASTATFRWWLWCFLFGESFFVPAVMWIRVVAADRNGAAFGRHRYAGLGVYLIACVVVPLIGMVIQLGRLP
jgi:hypothetical protein